jgi:PPOX class probable F420-dependent enzyme
MREVDQPGLGTAQDSGTDGIHFMSQQPGVGGRPLTSGTGSLRRVAGISIQGAARELLDSDAVAHVVTLNEDGSPHVTAAWVGVEGDEIVLATIPDQRKLRNLRRDPRIALSIPTTRVNDWGLLEYLVVYGTARVTEGGAPEMLQWLAHTYLGPDVVFPPMPNPPPGFVTRITPERFGGVGPWTPHTADERTTPRRSKLRHVSTAC